MRSGRFGPTACRCWPKIEPCWSNLAKVRSKLVRFGQCFTQSGQVEYLLCGRLPPGSNFGQLWGGCSATFGQRRSSPGSPWVTFRGAWTATILQHPSNDIIFAIPGLSNDAAITTLGCPLWFATTQRVQQGYRESAPRPKSVPESKSIVRIPAGRTSARPWAIPGIEILGTSP